MLHNGHQPRRFVLTGGPCTGKTTLLHELRTRGYQVLEEVGRQVIQEQLRNGARVLPWVDRAVFQLEVLRRRQTVEKQLPVCDVVFLDRGIPDGIAFCRLDGIDPPHQLLVASKESSYDGVFLLEPFDHYVQDSERYLSKEESATIHELIATVYTELHYELQCLPPCSVRKRADIVEAYVVGRNQCCDVSRATGEN